jgi:hypothetical protein
MSDLIEAAEVSAPEAPQYLVGIRVREPVMAEDYSRPRPGFASASS